VELTGESATVFQEIGRKFNGCLAEETIAEGLLNAGARAVAKSGKGGLMLFLESLAPGIAGK